MRTFSKGESKFKILIALIHTAYLLFSNTVFQFSNILLHGGKEQLSLVDDDRWSSHLKGLRMLPGTKDCLGIYRREQDHCSCNDWGLHGTTCHGCSDDNDHPYTCSHSHHMQRCPWFVIVGHCFQFCWLSSHRKDTLYSLVSFENKCQRNRKSHQ